MLANMLVSTDKKVTNNGEKTILIQNKYYDEKE